MRGERGTKGAPRAAPRAARRRGVGVRGPCAFKGPAAAPSACRLAAAPDVSPAWHRGGLGLGFSTPASERRSPGRGDRRVPICSPGVLQPRVRSLPGSAAASFPDPVPVAAPLRGGRRLGQALPKGQAVPCPAPGSAVVSCLGRVSFHRLSINPPASRRLTGAGAAASPLPRRGIPGHLMALAEYPLSRNSAARSRPCPRAPTHAQSWHPCVPAGWETAGSRGRERWESPPSGVERPRAGCCPAEMKGPGSPRGRGGGVKPGGVEQRGGHGWRRERVAVPRGARLGGRCHS